MQIDLDRETLSLIIRNPGSSAESDDGGDGQEAEAAPRQAHGGPAHARASARDAGRGCADAEPRLPPG